MHVVTEIRSILILKEKEIIENTTILKELETITTVILDNWEKHHCFHYKHTLLFPLTVIHDLDSLKLKEILRFQQDGRYCVSFC